jgi:hypothetical protein
MSNDTEKKLKLVRIVLFLDWKDHYQWRNHLINTEVQATKHTGHFPQYPLLSSPENEKLFGNFDVWRLLDLGKEGEQCILIDSHVIFFSGMERDKGSPHHWLVNFDENKRFQHGWVDLKKYKNPDEVLSRWPFLLTYPDTMRRMVDYDAKETYLCFHHVDSKSYPEKGCLDGLQQNRVFILHLTEDCIKPYVEATCSAKRFSKVLEWRRTTLSHYGLSLAFGENCGQCRLSGMGHPQNTMTNPPELKIPKQ